MMVLPRGDCTTNLYQCKSALAPWAHVKIFVGAFGAQYFLCFLGQGDDSPLPRGGGDFKGGYFKGGRYMTMMPAMKQT